MGNGSEFSFMNQADCWRKLFLLKMKMSDEFIFKCKHLSYFFSDGPHVMLFTHLLMYEEQLSKPWSGVALK